MTAPETRQYVYLPYLLVTAAAFASALLLYPHDTSIFLTLQSFSRRAGKLHLVREILEMFRPFGQGDVILLIAVGIGLSGSRRRALHIMLALAVMAMLIWPVKIGVGRERPAFKNFQSFPSGDAGTAAAFVTPLAGSAPWMIPVGVLITGGVATERAYYGRHYASDVVTGAGFGVLAGAMALAILRRWRWCPKRRWFAVAGILIVAGALTALLRPKGSPYLINVLCVWGPLGSFLILSRLIPAWRRKRNSPAPRQRPPSSPDRIWLRLAPAVAVTGGCALVLVPWGLPIFGLRIPLVAMGVTAIALAHALRRLRQCKRVDSIPAVMAAGLACLTLSIGTSLIPAILAYKNSSLTF